MILEIKPLNDGLSHNTRSCGDDQIASIAHWAGKDYELMYANSWSFRYLKDGSGGGIGERISISNEFGKRNLERYHGIHIFVHDNVPPTEAFSEFQNELALGMPVLIRIDAYWLPGNPSFNRAHYPGHIITIIGIDNKNNRFYFTDAFENQYNVTMSYDQFHAGYNNSYCTIRFHSDNLEKVSWQEILFNTASNFQTSQAADGIRKLALDIEKNFSFIDEITDKNTIWRNPICERILLVAQERRQFQLALKYLDQNYREEILLSFSDAFEKLGQRWGIVNNLFYKGAFVKNPQEILSTILTVVREIGDTEDDLCRKMLMVKMI